MERHLGQGYKDLLVWQRSIELVKRVYALSASFPKEEIFGLTSQVRRSAVSVPSNIAEGEGRISPGECKQFFGNARGSLLELETQFIIASALGYITEGSAKDLGLEVQELGRMLNGLIAHKTRKR